MYVVGYVLLAFVASGALAYVYERGRYAAATECEAAGGTFNTPFAEGL